MSSIVAAAILTLPRVATSKAILLQRGTHIEGTGVVTELPENLSITIDASRFLVEREDIDRCNLFRRNLDICDNALVDAQKQREEASKVPEPSFLDEFGWGGVLTSAVVLAAGMFVVGAVVGAKAVR